MGTLADPNVRAACRERIQRLDSNTSAKWGRMTARQMVCHLNDSFRVGMGEKYASQATNVFQRTLVKWIALRMPVPWPHGVPTRPEIEQGRGGTPPAEWSSDRDQLLTLMDAFAERTTFGVHPTFGTMSQRDWLAWGYRHVDHHLRQFGV
ncbi:MAG: DUF1569 domain-containing protein [Bryobacteraceae bacterium]|jgi:hypothetical protein